MSSMLILPSIKEIGVFALDEGSKPEVLSRKAQTTNAMTKLRVFWNDKHIAITSKIVLMISIWMLELDHIGGL